MMSPQLLVPIVVAMVSWINAVERCVDCSLLPTKGESDISRPASCSTDCYIEEQTKPEIFTPWSKLGPVLQFDNSGIYYEPVEMLPVDQVAVIQQPFYILNPAYQVDGRVSRSAMKLDEHMESPLSLNKHAPSSRHNIVDKYRQKEENGRKSERQLKKLPFYLDFDVQEPVTETRVNPDLESHFKNLKSSEQYLSICLDLHVITSYRKNYSTFMNLKEVWDAPKFHYYENWSDLDLEKEITKKCSHSTDILQKSLDEIKESWPKHYVLSFNSSRSVPVNARNGNISNQTFQSHSDAAISKAFLVKTLFIPKKISFTEQTSSAINIVKSTTLHNESIPINIVKDSVFPAISPYNNAEKQFPYTLISTADQINFDVTAASTVDNDTLAETTNITTVVQYPEVSETSSLPTLYVEDSLHLNSTYESGQKHIKSKGDLSSSTNTSFTNSKLFFIPMMQRTLNITPKDMPTLYDVITPNITEPIMMKSETIPGSGNNDASFTRTPYVENGDIYSEVNIEVSEIATKEYTNDTAISNIEDIKRSLFNNSIFVIKDASIVSVTSYMSTPPMTTANTIDTTDNKSDISEFINSENLSAGEHFTGNLYFLYRNHSVPARFIQHPDGKINVGLDGSSVCDSVNESTVKFVLLNVLCNCVKFNNCTDDS